MKTLIIIPAYNEMGSIEGVVENLKASYGMSIYLARGFLDDDIILLHGDLVFDFAVLCMVAFDGESCMAVDTAIPLPEKDFKAVTSDKRSIIQIGVDFFDNAVAAQPLYKINHGDWQLWMAKIVEFCESGQTGCYAEKAFNELNGGCRLKAVDVHGMLCGEIDTEADLAKINGQQGKKKSVYCCFSSDIIHGGHICQCRT